MAPHPLASALTPKTHDEELEILLAKFPEFTCICELCDCGRHLHHHGCTKGNGFGRKAAKAPMTLTHNQDVYRSHENVRPRSSKRPLPPGRDPQSDLPMFFQTQQRAEFIPRPLPDRVLAEVPKENIEIAPGKIDGKTSYNVEFHVKPLEPARAHMAKDRYAVPTSAKFETRTTNGEMYKEWAPQKTMKFAELPCLTGSIMFPDNKDSLPLSTTIQSYPGKVLPKPQPAKAAPNNLLLEGAHHMTTTNMDVYKGKEGPRAPLLRSQPQTVKQLGQFQGTSQTQADYKPQGSHERAKLILQPKETIELAFDNRRSFETEQRALYKGHDARAHPVVASCKKVAPPYTRPEVPVQGQTTTHMHFPRQEVAHSSPAKATRPPNSLGEAAGPAAKFDGRTINQQFYRHWGPHIQPRVRHGDPHENNTYVPPSNPFEAHSTTKDTFVEKPLEITKSFKPKEEGIGTGGEKAGGSYATVHKDTYKGHPVKHCKAKLYMMQQELLKRKKTMQPPRTAQAAN